MSNRSQTDRYRVRQQVVQWTENLIDLTRRNKLLNFRYSKLTTLEIIDPSWVVVVISLRPVTHQPHSSQHALSSHQNDESILRIRLTKLPIAT